LRQSSLHSFGHGNVDSGYIAPRLDRGEHVLLSLSGAIFVWLDVIHLEEIFGKEFRPFEMIQLCRAFLNTQLIFE
jgi:hypothetical protein